MPGAEPDALRAEVRRLRSENATARARGGRADDLARELVAAWAASGGRLADPTDLVYHADAMLRDDGMVSREAVDAAVTALLTSKPHLATRRPSGVVEQGASEQPSTGSLAAILRANAS